MHFHNEAWGGEKVFILLERLMREPKRYQDLLEFLYICFSLGFRGRYKVAAQDQANSSKSIAACITSCTSYAATRPSHYYTRTEKPWAGATSSSDG